MYYVFASAKVFKMHLEVNQIIPENFPVFSEILSTFPRVKSFLLKGSKILFHELQLFYLGSSPPTLSLGFFPEFSEYFSMFYA